MPDIDWHRGFVYGSYGLMAWLLIACAGLVRAPILLVRGPYVSPVQKEGVMPTTQEAAERVLNFVIGACVLCLPLAAFVWGAIGDYLYDLGAAGLTTAANALSARWRSKNRAGDDDDDSD